MSTPTRHGMPDTLLPTPFRATTLSSSAMKSPRNPSHKRKKITRASFEETKSPIKKEPTAVNPKSKKKAATPFERFNTGGAHGQSHERLGSLLPMGMGAPARTGTEYYARLCDEVMIFEPSRTHN
eukprot:scaffold28111_cov60-Attheya_sp.AAC.2